MPKRASFWTSAILLAVASWAPAQEASTTDQKAESYYHYCLARMHEMQMQGAEAIENYQRAAALDPTAAYPHVALASLYQRTRQADLALESVKRALELDPDVASAQRILGTLYFSMLRNGGSPELAPQAVEAFRNAVRLEPGDMESRSDLARLLIASREPAEAGEHLAEIIKFNARAYYEMFLLAQVRREEGDVDAAIELLEQSIAVEPRQPQAREMLVELLQQERRFADLSELYANVLEADATDLDARIRLADALANEGRLEESVREFEKALAEDPTNVIVLVGLGMVQRELLRLDEAEALLKKAIASAPSHVLARYTLASIYEQKRQYVAAQTQWQELLEIPDPSPEVGSRRAEYWAHLGFAHEQLGRLDDAVAAFSEARQLAEGDPRFEMFFIQGLLTAERAEEALRAVESVLEKDADSPRFLALKARALDASGDGDDALAMMLTLADEHPDEDVFAQAVVDQYHRDKKFEASEAFLRERLKGSPDDPNLQFQLAATLERQGKVDEAEAVFESILRRDPDSAAALNYLGYMLADHNRRLDESLDFVKRALSQDPYNGAYLDSLGWVYYRRGELDLAEENLLKAIDAMRLTGVVYDHLGDLYLEKGDPAQAVEYWKKALDQDDDEVERDEVAAKIERATSGQ